jgi:hypothetical protein
MKAFLLRFSKAIGALGGGGIGALIQWGFSAFGHPLGPQIAVGLPVVGSVLATVLAPPNSITAPSPPTP